MELDFLFKDLRNIIGELDNRYPCDIMLSKRELTIITDALQVYIENSKDQMTQEDIVDLVNQLEEMLVDDGE